MLRGGSEPRAPLSRFAVARFGCDGFDAERLRILGPASGCDVALEKGTAPGDQFGGFGWVGWEAAGVVGWDEHPDIAAATRMAVKSFHCSVLIRKFSKVRRQSRSLYWTVFSIPIESPARVLS